MSSALMGAYSNASRVCYPSKNFTYGKLRDLFQPIEKFLLAWLNRLNISTQNVLPMLLTAVLATVIAAAVAIWYPANSVDAEMNRFGSTLARSVAHMSAGHLIHKDRIELAVLANELLVQEEVAGVAFYDTTNDILAMSGANEMIDQYTAPATLDDTITGYVSIALSRGAFTPPSNLGRWLSSLAVVILAPFFTILGLKFSDRGNRSLPIVTVPDAPTPQPQTSFAIYVNLHNQLALGEEELHEALGDAMTMAREVCAIHHGVPIPLGRSGLLMLFDRTSVDAEQAICGSALVQTLLGEFDTKGEFRCFLDTIACPEAPSEMANSELTQLVRELNADNAFTRAAISRSSTILLSHEVQQSMRDSSWVATFNHPILEDDENLFLVDDLPEPMANLVAKQSQLILGFA